MHVTYQAVSRTGQLISETLEVPSAKTLSAELTRQGYEVVEMRVDWRKTILSSFGRKELKRKTLVEFFGYLKGLLELGLNISAALSTVQDSLDDALLRGALRKVEDMITKGYSLSEAFRETQVFPPLAIASISAAERTNRLEEVFTELADHYQRIDELASEAKKAATYPIIALFVLAGVFSMMLFFVVPQLKDILPPNPPLPTRILLWLSDTAGVTWWLIPAVPIGLWIGWRNLTASQRSALVERAYQIPIAGRIALDLELSTVFMNLAMLNGGGIALLEAIQIAADGAASPFIARRLHHCHDLAKKGGTLSEGFQDPLFPRVVSRAIIHGEATGRFDKQFSGLAKFLRERTASKIQFISSFIEPVLILVGGGIMLLMATAIFMPIYQQIQGMR